MPTRPELVSKIADINGLIERTWTDLEVSEKLKRQNTLHIKYSGVERDQITKQLDIALARGDNEAAARLQEKLDNLETPRLAFRTSLNTAAKKKADASARGLTQQEKLALLNAENRKRNAENVRKAQLLELTRSREGEATPSGTSTPLSRAAANGGNGNGSGDGTPTKSGLLPHIAKLQAQQRSQTKTGGLPVIHKPLMDDDIIGALDLDIDVEIE